jgi:hypothetical protein
MVLIRRRREPCQGRGNFLEGRGVVVACTSLAQVDMAISLKSVTRPPGPECTLGRQYEPSK